MTERLWQSPPHPPIGYKTLNLIKKDLALQGCVCVWLSWAMGYFALTLPPCRDIPRHVPDSASGYKNNEMLFGLCLQLSVCVCV